MIRRWFISYPRLICTSILWMVAVGISVCCFMYDPLEPSVLVHKSDVLLPAWWVYLCNSVAAVYLHACGLSGIFLLGLMVLTGLRVMQWVHVPWMSLFSGLCLIVVHAMLCAHIGFEPFLHIPAGGWVGVYGYALCKPIHAFYDLDIVLRVTLTVCALATFRFSWIRYVTPYAQYMARCVTALGKRIIPFRTIRVFPSLVQEHVAQETQEDVYSEDAIFHDAFWSERMGKKRSSAVAEQSVQGGDAHIGEHREDVYNDDRAERQLDASHTVAATQAQYGQYDRAKAHVASELPERPHVNLLHAGQAPSDEPDAVAQSQARRLEEKLSTFGITGHVTHITCGPVVTLFSYQPDKAVKVANILAREDDLRLALEAISLRIIAPIPGTSVVGFEVSRPQPQSVMLRTIINTKDFWSHETALPLALGTDTAGVPFVSDLAKMPHVLVAGATGSGKSVALHSFLVSLLYRCQPDDMKFVLIDPKRLEFAAYQDIPHLAAPVITQQKSVVAAFEWLVHEMERRYDVLAQAGVRNISEYHQRYSQRDLPYIVVVVDELADLMMGVGKDIEQYIARLAQMARAAGIHLIVATQRPSVDVVTGMIKVNFLSRIAFKVTSKIDSRTIIDQPGAEKLLGRGDMLHLDARGTLHRLHGGFLMQSEIDAVINHWSGQPYDAPYLFDPESQQTSHEQTDEEDALYDDVVHYVQSCDTVSISLIQRRFRIGYNRSARLVDALERNGIVSAADSNKMRRVLQ